MIENVNMSLCFFRAIYQSHKSHNALDKYPTMHHFVRAHFCYKIVHCGKQNCCIARAWKRLIFSRTTQHKNVTQFATVSSRIQDRGCWEIKDSPAQINVVIIMITISSMSLSDCSEIWHASPQFNCKRVTYIRDFRPIWPNPIIICCDSDT